MCALFRQARCFDHSNRRLMTPGRLSFNVLAAVNARGCYLSKQPFPFSGYKSITSRPCMLASDGGGKGSGPGSAQRHQCQPHMFHQLALHKSACRRAADTHLGWGCRGRRQPGGQRSRHKDAFGWETLRCYRRQPFELSNDLMIFTPICLPV